MTAVLVLARRDLVRRWRSALALTMLVGIVGAVVLAFAAGAHRSSTSLPRFIAYSRPSDAELDLENPTAAQLRAFRALPEVDDFAALHAFALVPRGRPNLKNAATVDGRIGVAVDRARVVAGRPANPAAPDEVMIGEGLAAQLHVGIGDYLEADSLAPVQLEMANAGKSPGPPSGPLVRLRIVGIYRRPLDLGDLAASGGVVIETPAFDRTNQGRIALYSTVLRVRTRNGAADVTKVTDDARRVFQTAFRGSADVSAEAHGAEDAINVMTNALWIVAGVAALAGAVAISIVLLRDVAQGAVDQPTLTALGLTRRQRIAALGIRVLLVVGVGAVIAAIGAVALSPVFPIGIARRAEPAPGLRIDWSVLGIGLLVIVAFIVLVGALAAGRATRADARTHHARPGRRTIAELASTSGLRPPAANGVRMAFEPGRGASALPVRSAYLGAVFGVVGLTAVLVFSASLSHLAASPRLYGWTWDFKAPDDTFGPGCGAADYNLSKVPGVGAVAAVCYQTGMPVGGRPTTGWGFTPVRGSIEPEIVAGRTPHGSAEVALGETTLHALHKRIGDLVMIGGKRPQEFRIVGQVVLPPIQDSDIQPLADGAALTGSGYARVADVEDHTRYLVADFAAGADRADVARRVGAMPAFNGGAEQGAYVVARGASGPTRPPEIERLLSIDWFPAVLALIVGLLALIALAHVLVTTVQRRRPELALLKTLGFERRQVRATLAWQATTLAVVGLVVGIPLGVLVGQLVWRAVTGSLGIAPTVVVPVAALVLTVPVVIALVNLVAFFPARAAARTWPARALAAE